MTGMFCLMRNRLMFLFHEFLADDIAMVQRIYEKAGLVLQQARDELNHFMAHHPCETNMGAWCIILRRDFRLISRSLARTL